jgi:hypothetical protein
MTNQEFKENYKCPKLQRKNLNAAYEICGILKEQKCLSSEAMIDALIKARRGHCMDRHYTNFTNIHTFLRYHDMCTHNSKWIINLCSHPKMF